MQWQFQAMTTIASAPMHIPDTLPSGPASGRNMFPGMAKAPHPTAQPNDSAHAANRENAGVAKNEEDFPSSCVMVFIAWGRGKWTFHRLDSRESAASIALA